MFQIVVVRGRDNAEQRLTFDKVEVSIGRSTGNDLVLPEGSISKRHARVVWKDDRYILVDLKSTNGTFVNGRKITAPIVIAAGDVIAIGDFVLSIADYDALEEIETVDADPVELRLLASIAQRDEASRLVYADWLEERGESLRAEFLRVQQALTQLSPDHPDFQRGATRLRELTSKIEPWWRFKVARPAIEGCVRFELRCPKEWGSLATTERSNVRFCDACQQKVHYCISIAEARRRSERGECIAVDAAIVRRPNDLDPVTSPGSRPDTGRTMGMMVPVNPPPPRRR
jgi:uncharacterized protein (TIGR02996 family)